MVLGYWSTSRAQGLGQWMRWHRASTVAWLGWHGGMGSAAGGGAGTTQEAVPWAEACGLGYGGVGSSSCSSAGRHGGTAVMHGGAPADSRHARLRRARLWFRGDLPDLVGVD